MNIISILYFCLFNLLKVEGAISENSFSSPSTPILKSFFADCSTNINTNPEYSEFCNLSVYFYSNQILTIPTAYTGDLNILVNNVPSIYSVEADFNSPYGANFYVYTGDKIEIIFNLTSSTNTYIPYFIVYNGPNGSGPEMVSSKDTSLIAVKNTCQTVQACTFTISAPVSWPDLEASNVIASISVNGITVLSFNGVTANFQASQGQDITLTITGVASTYLIQLEITDETSAIIFNWYSNAYYTPIFVLNPCFPSPPFGISLYPITPRQLNTFLQQNSAPISTNWFLLKGAEDEE